MAHMYRATDAERYEKVQNACPHIVKEYSMTFPFKIFKLKGPCGERIKDLIVMRKAPGQQLTYQMYQSIKLGGSVPALLDVMKEFGKFLKTIHRVYQDMQHGDCTASNIFYDESSGQFTLVDVADFGWDLKMAQGGDNDVEHFVAGLKFFSQHYGEITMGDCERYFRAGYNAPAVEDQGAVVTH